MKSRIGFFLFLLYLSRITEEAHCNDLIEKAPHYRLRFIKREAQGNIGPNEGQTVKAPVPKSPAAHPANQTVAETTEVKNPEPTTVTNKTVLTTPTNASIVVAQTDNHEENVVNSTLLNTTASNSSSTVEKVTAPAVNLKSPGVLKRAIIVFGTFTLLAVIYYIFYRRKNSKNDSNNTGNNDNNQFRYGVLQSEDRRDNLELSRIPLTIDSDEDDDEDLEVFDIEERRKNLTYVNLQTRDVDVVNSNDNHKDDDGDNLLLDIDDGSPDTSMDWMHSSSKSIL